MDNTIPFIDEWLQLSYAGKFQEAQELYFEKLFPAIVHAFRKTNEDKLPKGGILFSILGLSPEPILLTAACIEPEVHYIFTTQADSESVHCLKQYLTSTYKIICLEQEHFSGIYNTLKNALPESSKKPVTIDITGGKKSIVAITAIFGWENNCNIIYVDFKTYIKKLRRPSPGSEVLTIVYSQGQNQQ